MKQQRILLVLLLVLVALGSVYFAVIKYNENKELSQLEEDAQLAEESIISVAGLVESEVVSISWNFLEEYTFTLEGEDWIYTEDASLPIDGAVVEDAISIFCNLTATRNLEGGDTLDSYGLEEPLYTIILTDSSGQVMEYFVGNSTESDFYFTLGDKSQIYTVSSTYIGSLTYDLESTIKHDIFPVVTSGTMVEVAILQDEEEILYTTDDEGVFDTMAGGFGALAFSADTCIAYDLEGLEEDYLLGEGLRTEVTLTYQISVDEEIQETDVVLYIGTMDETETYYCVQLADSPLVYMVDVATIELILNP